MSIFGKLIDGVINFIDPPTNSPPVGNPLDRNVKPSKRIRDDFDAPHIFVGKIMDDGNIRCEVVAHNNKTNMHVKILDINWPRLGTYLDVGKTYPVYMHSNECLGTGMQIWEIAPKHMKRDTSQVLLAWEKEIGWTWDLDF